MNRRRVVEFLRVGRLAVRDEALAVIQRLEGAKRVVQIGMRVAVSVADAAVERRVEPALLAEVHLRANDERAGFADRGQILGTVRGRESEQREGSIVVRHVRAVDAAVGLRAREQESEATLHGGRGRFQKLS